MVSTTYSTGSWLGIVRSGSVIVLDGRTDPSIVSELWEFLGQEPTIHGVLNEVTEKFGTGLTGMPDFAIVVQHDRLHAILRGDITLLAHTGDGTETVSGRDVTTWSERSLPLADSIELTLAEPGTGEDTLVLPLGEGVVRLQSLAMVAQASLRSAAQTDDGGLPATAAAATDDAPTAENSAPTTVWNEGVPSDGGLVDESALVAGDFTAGTVSDDENRWALAPAAGGGADNSDTLFSAAPGFAPDADFEAAPDAEPSADFDAAPDAEPEPDVAPAWVAGPESGLMHGSESELAAAQDGDPEEEVDSEEDAEALASFAKAAEAADAEWNAQLAPLDAPDDSGARDDIGDISEGDISEDDIAEVDLADADLRLTIRPDHGYDDDGQHQPAEQEQREAGEHLVAPAGGESAVPADQEFPASVQEPAEDGFTVNYDYLFGATTMSQSVEAAAVRLDENGQPIPQAAGDQVRPPLPPMPPLPPAAGNGWEDPSVSAETATGQVEQSGQPGHPSGRSEQSQLTGQPGTDGPDGAFQPGAFPEGASESSHGNAQQDVEDGLLIDSVPWGNSAGQLDSQDAESRSSESSEPDEPYNPDHDGHTVMRGDFTSGSPVEPLESRPPTGPMVLARMCPNGHANPPSRSQCSDCGSQINSEAREVGRPRLGTMHISSGEVIELDHSLIIGRQPSVSRVMGGAMPRLVQVKSGNGDISRSHVEVRLDGWDVLLVDLKATNGTVLVREGQAPRRLSQGEEAILLNGDIAELGDGVSLLFDGLL